MNLRELKELVDEQVKHLREYENPRVVVPVEGSGIGGTSCVDVTHVYCGFDWDKGKFIIKTEGRRLKEVK